MGVGLLEGISVEVGFTVLVCLGEVSGVFVARRVLATVTFFLYEKIPEDRLVF